VIKRILFVLPLLCIPSLESSILDRKLSIDLTKANYRQGVLSTDEGGIITGEDLRIQAKKISYIDKSKDKNPVHLLIAEQDLLFVYKGQIFVGEALEYDFISRKGKIINGKTCAGLWYFGAHEIDIDPDGNFYLKDAFITTSEGTEPAWETRAKEITLSNEGVLTARNLSFRVNDTLVFAFPWFQNNLKSPEDPPLRYKVTWDKSLGPRLSARYRLLSTPYSDIYVRLDYRIPEHYGGAVETEFYSKDERTYFLTKNYGAHDKSIPQQQGYLHYRFQGLFHSESIDERFRTDLVYDRISDEKQPDETFPSDDFEIDTRLKTILVIEEREDNTFGTLTLQPRINRFQSINQELPMGVIGIRPYNFGETGLITENQVSAGYLDYVYAKELDGLLPDFHAARLETNNQVYRPFHLRYFTLTPKAGAQIIFYNNSPYHEAQGQIAFNYELYGNTVIMRRFDSLKHFIEPYLHFYGLSRPTLNDDAHYIFGIDDGLTEMNLLKFGVRNDFYFSAFPTFSADLWSAAWFGAKSYKETIPLIYGNFSLSLPSLLLTEYLAWNAAEHVLDFSNLIARATINQYFAFSLEFRYRSKYAWRKSDYDNFMLDFARDLDNLLLSPLSDRRFTVLGKVELQISPRWTLRYTSHNGFGRRTEPGYNAQKVDLITRLTSHWKMRLSYEHFPGDDRFTYSLKLVK
jgi:hypothetical protein